MRHPALSLTLNKPKPLLTVASRPIINYVVKSLAPIPNLDHVYVVFNPKFASLFQQWADAYRRASSANLEFTIVNDGSNSRVPVFTWRVPGLRHDIGSPETLEEANRLFAQYGAMRGPSRSDR